MSETSRLFSVFNEDEGFLKLAKKIKKLFPTEEIETWHASSRDSKGNLVVTGRLRTKYDAVRRGLIRANLIESRRSAKKSNNSVIPDDSFNADDDPEISWLMTNDSPWTEVLTKWDASVAVRRQIVLHLKYYSEYIEKFPALRTQLGWELIAQDGVAIEAKLAQPDWRKWVDVMIKLIRREKGKSEFLKEPNLSDGKYYAIITLLRVHFALTRLSFIFTPFCRS
ncbi:uncharacterized protein LOC127750621 [Frankliniella occidentalis]|uniref:Uncharacterized protein LOC127750621 n=1 Tax=Frankliniella occidentalis TaxID=133901 RepID=A0A9C6X3V9_FRAOC|nr:uncharacterized protein LOC127750621 [Frankliniella occidentalis]